MNITGMGLVISPPFWFLLLPGPLLIFAGVILLRRIWKSKNTIGVMIQFMFGLGLLAVGLGLLAVGFYIAVGFTALSRL
ncbi:MAG: hypothetical protein ACREX9_04805 [Gammaproteobacteria bacterium]